MLCLLYLCVFAFVCVSGVVCCGGGVVRFIYSMVVFSGVLAVVSVLVSDLWLVCWCL